MGVRADLEQVMNSAGQTLNLRFTRFEDPALERCAEMALSRGAKVRLILRGDEKPNRLAAERLKTMGIRLRFALSGDEHYAVADGMRAIFGSFDGCAETLDLSLESVGATDEAALARDFQKAFEREWSRLSEKPPKEMTLSDELEALPDPRIKEPRVRVKRRSN